MADLKTRALTAEVSRREAKQFFRSFSREHPSTKSWLSSWRLAACVVVFLCTAVFLLAMGVGIAEEIRAGAPDAASQVFGMVTISVLMLYACGVMTVFFVRTQLRKGTPERHYRLWAFARDNGMQYLPGPYGGQHLTPWRGRGRILVSRVMRSRFVELGNYDLMVGAGNSRDTALGGYMYLRVHSKLPHILLKAKRNERLLSPVPAPKRAQRLDIGGEFSDHFTLYCPEGYERDALYLFSFDIMARAIDSAGDFDIELVDDWVFFTRPGEIVTLNPDDWERSVEALSAIGTKVAQWERWRDENAATSHGEAPATGGGQQDGHLITQAEVAEQGRRLKSGVARTLWVVVGAAVLLAVANILVGLAM
ncbi:hypothetical protein [Georgenia alba]|uniref:DUF3137 domain-containing protein n=1 Tax=Georgenia alba TaxID=2233858 RepID=A0ABW2QEF9_9MICO